MSWQSWQVSNDLRQQIQDSDRKGHSAGKNFMRQNRRKDKIWFSGALQEIEGQVKDMHLPEAVQGVWRDAEGTFGPDNPVSKGVENLQHIVDPSSWITDYLKGNLPEACLRASFSCAIFHEVKRRVVKRGAARLKERHPKLRRLPAATDYVCDVMLPTPLYGPFFVFLVGKAREWVVGTTLGAVGLGSDN